MYCPLSNALHLTLFATYSLPWKGCSAVKVSHKFKNSIFRPSSNYIQFHSRCWKSSFSALSRKPVLKDQKCHFGQFSNNNQLNISTPAVLAPKTTWTQRTLYPAESVDFFWRECLTCWSFRLLGVRLVLVRLLGRAWPGSGRLRSACRLSGACEEVSKMVQNLFYFFWVVTW